MTIDPASAATESSNVDAFNMEGTDAYSLSPESILQWLSTRLGNRDELIHTMLGEVQNRDMEYKNLSKKIQALQAIRSAMLAEGGGNDHSSKKLSSIHVTWNGRDMTADTLLNELNISGLGIANQETERGNFVTVDGERYRVSRGMYDNLQRASRDSWPAQFRGGELSHESVPKNPPPPYTSDMKIRRDTLTAFKEQLSTQQRSATTGRDILTTRLQSEIQARSQDVTIGTQLTRNVNDSRMAILRNLR